MLRNVTKTSQWLAAIALAILCFANRATAQELRLVTFGGASLNGNYFAIAKEVCRKINDFKRPDLRCSPEATPGSLYNLQAMRRGELDFALVQSDWHKSAFLGTGTFSNDGPMTDLRSVISLYKEALTFAARSGLGIHSLDDLKGKTLDIGHPSTGRRATIQRLVDALDFPEDFLQLRQLTDQSLVEALCGGVADATMVVVGHPNPAMARILDECKFDLIPVSGPSVDVFLTENLDYSPFVVATGTYPYLMEPIKTFSVSATLVVRADIPDEIVSLFLGTIIENYEELRSDLPVLPAGDPLPRREDGLTAPLHPGAVSVFHNAGG